MTLKSESNVCAMRKKSGTEIGDVIMIVEQENKVFGMHKRAGWRLDAQ